MPVAGLLALGAAGDDHDDRGDLRVAGADGLPGGLQDVQHGAGRVAVGVGDGELVPGAGRVRS